MNASDVIQLIINKFIIGHLSKATAEQQISNILGGKWVLTNSNDEWIVVKFNS